MLSVSMLFSGCRKDHGTETGPDEGQKGFSVFFFEVREDSDAILLMSPEGNVMIDTGLYVDAPRLIDTVKAKGVEHIDLLILTHPDKDHIGGAQAVLNNFQVDRVIMSRAVKNSDEQKLLNIALDHEGLKVDIPRENESCEFGDLKLTIYPAWQEDYKKTNDYSVAVLAEYAGKKFFFPGDAEKERLTELLGEESIPVVDVYKLPHHGRDGKKTDKMLEVLKPSYCIVTAAAPGESVAQTISKIGAKTLSTFDGEIRITVDAETGEMKAETMYIEE